MAVAGNLLENVRTYNESGLALLLNSFAFINKANKKFKHFDADIPKQLGDTVGFDLPPRFTTVNSLVANWEDAVQRRLNLTVDQEISTSYEFNVQQFIFQARDYMDKFGRSAVAEIGSKIEADVAQVARTSTYRFFGDGVTAPSAYLVLANALARFRNFGAAKDKTCAILPDVTYPAIVNSGLGQFVLDRNQKQAMSWEVGRFSNCDWYQSNLLPVHEAGNVGQDASVLTVVSVVTNAAGGVTSITFSGAAVSDADAVKQYDKFEFSDGVSGQPNLRFRTFIGHEISQNPVQFSAAADAASDGAGNVTVIVNQVETDPSPPLQATAGKDQNINVPIVAGMQASVLPSHRCGLIMAGDPLYLAMPRLPEEVPFPTSVVTDPDSGASLRQYYGSQFAQNRRGMVHDAIWGKTLVPEYSMMYALPL
jgi:hypothetical protein